MNEIQEGSKVARDVVVTIRGLTIVRTREGCQVSVGEPHDFRSENLSLGETTSVLAAFYLLGNYERPALSSEDATRPTSSESSERPLMPSVPAGEGFFAAEGDERCGRVHIAARARCLMPKGHTGNHANTQGYWLDTEAADGWPVDATRPTGDKR